MDTNKNKNKNEQRSEAGQYAHGLARVCQCGHRKGEHTAARPQSCLAPGHTEACGCHRFRAAKEG